MKKLAIAMIILFCPVVAFAGNLGLIGFDKPYTSSDLQKRYDYSSGTTVIYQGAAIPGVLSTTARWQIKKYDYDGNDNVVRIDYAESTNGYQNTWADRTGYTYGADTDW